MGVNVVIAGGSEKEVWLHARAYGAVGAGGEAPVGMGGRQREEGSDSSAVLTGVWCEGVGVGAQRAGALGVKAYRTFEAVLEDPRVDVVELLPPLDERIRKAVELLQAGKNVLMGSPCARSEDEANVLFEATRGARGSLMSYEPWRFYPPFAQVAELVRKQTLGRIQAIRMRTVLAGQGGWDTYLNPDFRGQEALSALGGARAFEREVFEKLALAAHLLGPVDEISLAGQPPAEGSAGACLVTFKHQPHATYGALEFVVSPEMSIRSPYEAREDLIELTGTAGVLWLTRGAAQMRSEPTVRIYRGENQFAYGHLDDDWLSAYRDCAAHFADCVARRRPPRVGLEETLRAVRVVEALSRGPMLRQRLEVG